MGSGLPVLSTVTLAGRCGDSWLIAKNSLDGAGDTDPVAHVTATGQVAQKTKMPSDVAGSASASTSSSWTKKPRSWPAPCVW